MRLGSSTACLAAEPALSSAGGTPDEKPRDKPPVEEPDEDPRRPGSPGTPIRDPRPTPPKRR